MENVPVLHVLQGPGQGRRLQLAKERLILGRDDDVDFGFNDKKLSREHAEILHREGAWEVRDLGSRNGTSLNGNRLGADPVVLKPGDRITLGLVELEFLPEGSPLTSRLRVIEGPRSGREFPLDGRKVILGRSEEGTEIALNDQAASRQNTELECRDDTWLVRDLDSRNGTDCDGARLPSGTSVQLHSGARLRVGASIIEFLDHRIEDRVGTMLSGYQLTERIAAGPCGVVYRGRGDAGEVAVKLLDPVLAADTHESLRFINGARAQARIQHPNVARVLSAEVVEGQSLVVAELAAGGSLAQRIAKANGPLPAAQVATWIRDAARGLQAAEEKNLVHRSLRPGNLLLDREDAVAVADFATGATYLSSAPHGGPPTNYLAPEEVSGAVGDGLANQFSLGCIMHHALTGMAPFHAIDREATAWARHDQLLAPITSANPAAGNDVAKVCARLLARAPEKRYPGWAEAAADLDALVRGVAPATVALPSGQSALPMSLPSSRLRVAAASATSPFPGDDSSLSSAVSPDVPDTQRLTVPPVAIKLLLVFGLVLVIAGFVLPAMNRSAHAKNAPPIAPPPPTPVSTTRPVAATRTISPNEMMQRQQEAEDRARLAALEAENAIVAPVEIPAPAPAPVNAAPVVEVQPAPGLVVQPAEPSGPPPALAPQIIALFAIGGAGNQFIREVGFDQGQAWGKGAGFAVSIDCVSGAATVTGDANSEDRATWDWKSSRSPTTRTELHDPRTGATYAITTLQVHPILQQPELTSSAGWKLWGWTHAQVADEHKAVRGGPLMADSRGYDLWLMPDGNLGVLCWTDGANSVLTRDPRDLEKANDAVESTDAWRATAGGMASLFMLIDGRGGTPLSGTFVKSHVTNRVVDPWGRVYLPRAQDGAIPLEGSSDKAGGGLFVLGSDLRQPVMNARIGGGNAPGGVEGFAVLALRDNLLVLGGTTNSATPPNVNGPQSAPGGGQDAFLCVLKLW